MDIHFNGVDFNSQSGPNTFAGRLAHQFTLDGHRIVGSEIYDVCLIFIEPTHNILPDKPTIQRLDGVWFKPNEFDTKNRLIKYTYNYVDAVVFQSEFNKKQITNWWGEPKKHTVIHNGIRLDTQAEPNDLEKFGGLAAIRQQFTTVFCCSANWHGQKRLRENVRLFKHLQEFHPNSCLIVMGSNPEQIADKSIFYTGTLPHEICLLVYAISDWMIHLAWADHCPNVVVECLSQNTPVICTDCGGTQEIVKENGVVIPETVKYDFGLADYDNPPSLDFSMFTNPLTKPQIDASYLDIKIVAKQYEKLFESVIK